MLIDTNDPGYGGPWHHLITRRYLGADILRVDSPLIVPTSLDYALFVFNSSTSGTPRKFSYHHRVRSTRSKTLSRILSIAKDIWKSSVRRRKDLKASLEPRRCKALHSFDSGL